MKMGNKSLFSHVSFQMIRLINSIFTFTVGSARATAKLGIGLDLWHPQSNLEKEVLEHKVLKYFGACSVGCGQLYNVRKDDLNNSSISVSGRLGTQPNIYFAQLLGYIIEAWSSEGPILIQKWCNEICDKNQILIGDMRQLLISSFFSTTFWRVFI